MQSRPQTRSISSRKMENISEIEEITKPEFNIAIIGTISSGKSTLLNAIFGKTYSEMKIRRTTMIPSQYKLADIDELQLDVIQETNNKLNEKYAGDKLWDGIELPVFHVPSPYKFSKMSKYLDIGIYDIPGLNDQKTKDIYYKWVRENTQNFDIIYLLYDINSGLNTSDELELLQLVCGMMSANKRIKTIILGNKCDSLVLMSDGTFKMEDEHRDIFEKQMIPTITSQMETHKIDIERYKVIPFCSRMIYIYRTLNNLSLKEKMNIISILKNADNFDELNKLGYLNFKHLEEIMINDLGKLKWNRMPNEKKVKLLEKMLAINKDPSENENEEVIEMAGGNLLFDLTHKFMDKKGIFDNIIFRLFGKSDLCENIMNMASIKNIHVSKKFTKNMEFQKKLFQKAIKSLKIDNSVFKPTNIKIWSKIILSIHDLNILYDLNNHDNEIIVRGEKAFQDYIEELYKLGMSNLQNHEFILKIQTILDEYGDIIELLYNGVEYKEAIYNIQKGLYDKYIQYFENQKGNLQNINRLINTCLQFAINNSLDLNLYLKMYDYFIDRKCFGLVLLRQSETKNYTSTEIYTYMLETLKYVDSEFKNNIKIKARINAVDLARHKYRDGTADKTISDYENILNQVYDFDNNNYYKVLLKTIIECKYTETRPIHIGSVENVLPQINSTSILQLPITNRQKEEHAIVIEDSGDDNDDRNYEGDKERTLVFDEKRDVLDTAPAKPHADCAPAHVRRPHSRSRGSVQALRLREGGAHVNLEK